MFKSLASLNNYTYKIKKFYFYYFFECFNRNSTDALEYGPLPLRQSPIKHNRAMQLSGLPGILRPHPKAQAPRAALWDPPHRLLLLLLWRRLHRLCTGVWLLLHLLQHHRPGLPEARTARGTDKLRLLQQKYRWGFTLNYIIDFMGHFFVFVKIKISGIEFLFNILNLVQFLN